MKKFKVATFSVILLLGIGLFLYFHDNSKKEYNFLTTSTVNKSGVNYHTNRLIEEIKKMGWEDKIVSTDEMSVNMKLTEHEYNKILHLKQTKKYIEYRGTKEESKQGKDTFGEEPMS